MFTSPARDYNGDSMAGDLRPGIVVNNNDPMMLQRCQIRVSQMHQNCPDNVLPWCKKVGQGPGNTSSTGEVSVPVVGANVWVHYPEDDVTNAYYMGSESFSSTILNELMENYPYTYGRIDQANNLFVVNTAQKIWKLILSQGTSITIDNSGVTLNIAGEFLIKTSGEFSVSASVINMQANSINLNSGANAATNLPAPVARPALTLAGFSNKQSY